MVLTSAVSPSARVLIGCGINDPVPHVCGGMARYYPYAGGFGPNDKTLDLDPAGEIIRKFGDKGSVPTVVNPFFYAMFQLLPGGNIVLASWQGHGKGHGAPGIQLLEFSPAGEIVWTWSRAEMILSLQGVVVLDGLDWSRLHDERAGLMQPIARI
jgi:hypothetical protein